VFEIPYHKKKYLGGSGVGATYGFLSACLNQPPPFTLNNLLLHWHWQPNPLLFPSWLCYKLGIGTVLTRSGFFITNTLLFFVVSTVIGAILGLVVAFYVVHCCVREGEEVQTESRTRILFPSFSNDLNVIVSWLTSLFKASEWHSLHDSKIIVCDIRTQSLIKKL
jgi:hypothetical protein